MSQLAAQNENNAILGPAAPRILFAVSWEIFPGSFCREMVLEENLDFPLRSVLGAKLK